MKSLSLSSPMAIIVVGLPGAGKSFFARSFAATFNAPIVSEDRIRHMLFATHTYSRDENAMVAQVANMLIDELFKTEKTFILDGGFNVKAARLDLMQRATRAGYRTLVIWVQTDEPTSEHRALHRDGRRTGDEYKQSLTPETFDMIARRFTPPTGTEPHVVISGKHTYATQGKAVLKRLVVPQPARTQITVNSRPGAVRGKFIS